MNTAYLLLAHTQPNQLAFLIKALAHPNNSFFIHVDAKANIDLFIKAIETEIPSAPVYFLTERVACQWGQYSLVAATLKLLRIANAHQTLDFDHFILLSGQDYPLKSPEQVLTFLDHHRDHDFIEHFALPTEHLRERQNGLYRINRYHYFSEEKHKEFPPYSKKPVLNSFFNFLANTFHKYVRKMPLGMEPYAGSQWWILCRQTVGDLLNFLNKNPQVEHYFRNTWIPDELFFQTVVKHVATKSSVHINYNYRAIIWPKSQGKQFVQSPKILTETDWEYLKKSEALFARKFDEEKSRSLVEKLKYSVAYNLF